MNSKSLRQISTLAGSTTGSRVLGLVRDATFFSCFGTSLMGSAFIIAFTIPNLFRRLLGEGALASAFLPVFTQQHEKETTQGFKLLNQTLTRLFIVLGSITLLLVISLLCIQHLPNLPEKWVITSPLVALLLPYALLICFAAILTAALNALDKFFIASLSPILLNVMMISALIVGGLYFAPESIELARILCVAVLLGGLLQFLLPAIQTFTNGWKPHMDFSATDGIAKVQQLFGTATAGAAILQINILATRIIAFTHSDEAVSQLYIASRLTELPLGVFAVAIYTVLFPKLAKHVAENDTASFSKTCTSGVLMTLAITVPAAVGLATLAGPILASLFQWGHFDSESVNSSAPVLAIYSASVPFYALIAFLTRVFHAQQDMRVPLKVAGIALVTNLTLSIALVIPFGVKGLATATVATSALQLGVLSFYLKKASWFQQSEPILGSLVKIALSSIIMFAVVYFAGNALSGFFTVGKIHLIGSLAVIIVFGALSYAASAWVLGLKRLLLVKN